MTLFGNIKGYLTIATLAGSLFLGFVYGTIGAVRTITNWGVPFSWAEGLLEGFFMLIAMVSGPLQSLYRFMLDFLEVETTIYGVKTALTIGSNTYYTYGNLTREVSFMDWLAVSSVLLLGSFLIDIGINFYRAKGIVRTR